MDVQDRFKEPWTVFCVFPKLQYRRRYKYNQYGNERYIEEQLPVLESD